jgi:transcriptional regulator with XRE-family HTH domain
MKVAINASQSRAARALLGWSRQTLAEASLVASRTIIDFERGARRPHTRTLADIGRAFEDAGVIFIDEDDDAGVGVRLRKRPTD